MPTVCLGWVGKGLAYLTFCWAARSWAGCGGASCGRAGGSYCAAGPCCRRPWPASDERPPLSAGLQTSCRREPRSPGWNPAHALWKGTPHAGGTLPCGEEDDTLEQGAMPKHRHHTAQHRQSTCLGASQSGSMPPHE